MTGLTNHVMLSPVWVSINGVFMNLYQLKLTATALSEWDTKKAESNYSIDTEASELGFLILP